MLTHCKKTFYVFGYFCHGLKVDILKVSGFDSSIVYLFFYKYKYVGTCDIFLTHGRSWWQIYHTELTGRPTKVLRYRNDTLNISDTFLRMYEWRYGTTTFFSSIVIILATNDNLLCRYTVTVIWA